MKSGNLLILAALGYFVFKAMGRSKGNSFVHAQAVTEQLTGLGLNPANVAPSEVAALLKTYSQPFGVPELPPNAIGNSVNNQIATSTLTLAPKDLNTADHTIGAARFRIGSQIKTLSGGLGGAVVGVTLDPTSGWQYTVALNNNNTTVYRFLESQLVG